MYYENIVQIYIIKITQLDDGQTDVFQINA